MEEGEEGGHHEGVAMRGYEKETPWKGWTDQEQPEQDQDGRWLGSRPAWHSCVKIDENPVQLKYKKLFNKYSRSPCQYFRARADVEKP